MKIVKETENNERTEYQKQDTVECDHVYLVHTKRSQATVSPPFFRSLAFPLLVMNVYYHLPASQISIIWILYQSTRRLEHTLFSKKLVEILNVDFTMFKDSDSGMRNGRNKLGISESGMPNGWNKLEDSDYTMPDNRFKLRDSGSGVRNGRNCQRRGRVEPERK